jgi:hypothetical protein
VSANIWGASHTRSHIRSNSVDDNFFFCDSIPLPSFARLAGPCLRDTRAATVPTGWVAHRTPPSERAAHAGDALRRAARAVAPAVKWNLWWWHF